jgi:hypothetical protein
MSREEMKRKFVDAGWATRTFSKQLLIGNFGDLSILAYGAQIGSDDPTFELLDHKWETTYRVRVVPTPRVAAVLLEEHGIPLGKGEASPRRNGSAGGLTTL